MADEGSTPLHDSLADAVIAAAVHASLFGEAEPPPRLGRFRVLRSLGAGAMGTVWLARDEELDREVAVKLLRADHGGDPELEARMVAEAKGLARVSHPHVVVVHEVGTTERGIFIAMEYVDGGTLARWQEGGSRSVAEIIEMYVQIGRGLGAAHAAGIVHRDFKPDNVLVGTDGRPRVVDFGLACIGATDPIAAPDGDLSKITRIGDTRIGDTRIGDTRIGDTRIGDTRIGEVIGTPAYMAPEQLAGGRVDARSDQFAFALAMFEALAGRPAFADGSIAARRAALAEQALVWPPAIPRGLRRTLARALAIDPSARWPDMPALVAGLGARPRRWWPLPVVGAALGAALVLGRVWADADECRGAAALERGLWTASRQQALVEAFEGSAMPFAEESMATTRAAIDGAAMLTVDAARAACAADGLRDDPAFAPASAACLLVMRDEIEVLLHDLEHPSASGIAAAPLRATSLPDASACSDPRRAKLVGNLDAEAWARLAPAREALARARIAHTELVFGSGTGFAARLDTALADARDAAAQAESESAYVTAALARMLEARLLIRRGDTTAAETAASRAVEHGAAIDDPRLRTIAMILRVYAVGATGNRAAEARAVVEQASASIAAAGDPPLLRGLLENNLALVLARDGQADQAESIDHHRRAIALFAAALGEAHPDTMAARVNLGSALARMNRNAEALSELDPIVEPALAVWGEDHPSTARLFGVIGNAWLRTGDLAQADSWLRRALHSAERFAPGDAEVANAQYNLATALRRRMPDEPGASPGPQAVAAAAEAVTLLRAAIAIRERLEGPQPENLIAYRVALGEAELGAGDDAAAQTELRRALEACERMGASALDFARVRLALARAVAKHDAAEARLLVRAAREAFVREGRSTSVQACDRLLGELAAR